MNKPLTTEAASPCMMCGSVQCAFCSDDVLSAREWLKNEIIKNRHIELKYAIELCAKVDEAFDLGETK